MKLAQLILALSLFLPQLTSAGSVDSMESLEKSLKILNPATSPDCQNPTSPNSTHSVCDNPYEAICEKSNPKKNTQPLADQIRDQAMKVVEKKYNIPSFKAWLSSEFIQPEQEMAPLRDQKVKAESELRTIEFKIKQIQDLIAKKTMKPEVAEKELKEAESRRDQQNAILSDISAKMLALQKKQSELIVIYADYVNALLDDIFNRFKEKFGIDEQSFPSYIGDLKKQLITGLQNTQKYPKLKSDQTSKDHPETEEAIIEKINNIKLLDYRNITQKKSPVLVINLLKGDCSLDGTSVQASYMGLFNVMNICPGYLIHMLETDNFYGMSFAVGHELAHSLPTRDTSGSSQPPKAMPICLDFQNCIEKNFASSFSSISDFKNTLSNKAIPNLKKKITELEAAQPQDDERLYEYKRALSIREGAVKDSDSRISHFNGLFPPKASIIQTHMEELRSDYWGTLNLSDFLSKAPEKDRLGIARAGLDLFCSQPRSPIKEEIYKVMNVEIIDDGVHPPHKFRIENVFRNPDIRKLMGCAPFKEEDHQPWCSM